MRHEAENSKRWVSAAALAATVAVGLMGMGWLGGCQTGSRVDAGLPEYPNQVRQSAVLDVQVVRNDTHITMTNTTARSIGKARIWVNGWFSHDIDGFGVGQTMELNLYDFKDPYGTAFRAGGFFATERPESLVRAQIEPLDVEPRELLGLIVVGRSED